MLAKAALRRIEQYAAYDEVDRAIAHTNWPGRMQWMEYRQTPLLLDCAHNPSGMARACEQIRFQKTKDMSPMPGVIVIGCTEQKDLGIFLQPLVEIIVEGNISHVYVTQPPDGRKAAVDCTKLARELESQGTDAKITAITSVQLALDAAQEMSFQLDNHLPQPILCIGSIYLIGAILELINEEGMMEFQNILVTPKGEDGVDPIA